MAMPPGSFDENYGLDSSNALMDEPAHPQELEVVSVQDEEAFARRHMQDLGEEVEDYRVFHWKIKNYKAQQKRLVSPEFECGGHRWNVLLFPTGNSSGQANDMVSVYLNYGDPKHAKEGWHVCAQFALAISNPNDPTCFIQSQAHHRFNNDEQDWGFTRFVELRKLYTAADQRPKPVIEGEETIISAFVRVLKDPTGVLWHNFQNYDSKKETGYVGLKNQGATCYMNSLLQSLFLTNFYRRAVYQIPTANDSLDSVPLALQRVFYLLQTSDQPVSTNELTKSFGWKGFDSFLQHDVQEFNRVLQDKLEAKMKGTEAEGTIMNLFGGKMKSYIRCINVDFESSSSEVFLDIQLNVRGNKTLLDSFRDYCFAETMDGENQWRTEQYGMQDAKKGYIFEAFPPVLHLQLKRFEYDMERDVNIKINDRHEFPFQIDLGEFLSEDADRSESWVYQLHGVLVHSGDVHGGHYFVLIKPTADGEWFRFDDDRVVRVTDREVLEDNYGGEALAAENGRPPAKGAQKRFINAYMLVYIRQSKVRSVLQPLSDADTPSHLRSRLERERKDAEQKRKDREEQHLYLTAKVITDEHFVKHQGFDLATFDDRTMPATELLSYKVPKAQPFVDFKQQLINVLALPGDVRLWVLVNRQNKTVRPDTVVPDDASLTMDIVRDRMASRQHDLKLYLEHQTVEDRERWQAQYPNEQPIMLFVKRFDVESQTLHGVGHFYVHRHLRVSDLVGMINERERYPPGTPLKLYEEIKPGMIEPMKLKSSFLQSEIQDGDIVCFQTEMSEQAIDLDKQNKCQNPIEFYDWMQNRVAVRFAPRLDEEREQFPEFELILSRKDGYDRMAQEVGDHLRHDPAKLRFSSSHSQTGQPTKFIRRNQQHTLADILQPTYQQPPAFLLYFETLDISLVELETKKNVRVTWMGVNNKEVETITFLQPKSSTMGDLLEAVTKSVKLTPDGSGRIRLFSVQDGRKMHIYNPSDRLELAKTDDFFADEITLEETLVDDSDDQVIGCYFFQKKPDLPHGVPFKFVIRQGEAFSETKKRLQARLALGDKEFAKLKFALVQPQQYVKPNFLDDGDVLSKHRWHEDELLGIDSLNRKKVSTEQSIKIK